MQGVSNSKHSDKQLPPRYEIQLSAMIDSLLTNSNSIYQPKEEAVPNLSKTTAIASNDKDISNQSGFAHSKRSLLNTLLIIFCTFQVVLIINSKVYIDVSLVRSFLTFYVDQDVYPEVFAGDAFYMNMQNIVQLQQQMEYMLGKMSSSQSQTINNLNFSEATVTLQVQYHAQVQQYQDQNTFIIDPQIGIVEPFNLTNTTDLQLFLLKTKFFEIEVAELSIKNEGLTERYNHRVFYDYSDSSQISVSFSFTIDNVLSNTVNYSRPQDNELLYLRLFYILIIFLALMSFYLNILYVRRTFKQFDTYLEQKSMKKINKPKRRPSIFEELNKTQIKQIDRNIASYVQASGISIDSVQWKDYLRVVQFQVLFALLSSSFQIISSFYLFFGRQHEELIGLACLFAWMTIFKTLQKYKKLTLMYQLIKLSIIRVIQFSTSFFLIFMGFSLFGTTVFPKSRFFASLSYSVTTLISMMAGDSIDMITSSIQQKYSTTIAILYIFSYVIIFMHAIHNTLTSIIKEYFILRKIELIEEEKERLGETEFLYIEQIPIESQKRKQQLPLKLTISLQKEILKIKKEKHLKAYQKRLRTLLIKLQSILLHEKMMLLDQDQRVREYYEQNIGSRLIDIRKVIKLLLLARSEPIQNREVAAHEQQ